MVRFFYRSHISYLSRRVVFYRIVWNCVSDLLCNCSTSINIVLEKRFLFPDMTLLYFQFAVVYGTNCKTLYFPIFKTVPDKYARIVHLRFSDEQY